MVSKYEQKAKKELRESGYLVDWKLRPNRPMGGGYSVDFFNLFDILAYKAGEPLRMISIKGHAGIPGEHRKGIEEFNSPGVIKEIWCYRITKKVTREIIT